MLAKAIAIPRRMRHLPRDPRGYPIPITIWRDKTDRPHFTINNEATRLLCLFEDRCPICGQTLLPNRWFVGGPGSAFDPNGVYIDPPMHRECARYALRVCPYLAAPNYSGRIDAATVKPENMDKHQIFMDNTMDPERPTVFVAVEATGQTIIKNGQYIKPQRPYQTVQYWRQGKQIAGLEP